MISPTKAVEITEVAISATVRGARSNPTTCAPKKNSISVTRNGTRRTTSA